MIDKIIVDLKDAASLEKARGSFSQVMIEKQIRTAILFCFLSLPEEKKTLSVLESEFRLVVENVLLRLNERGMSFFESNST